MLIRASWIALLLALGFVPLVWSLHAAAPIAGPSSAVHPTELKRLRILTLDAGAGRFDPSGLAIDPATKRLVTVNDKWQSLRLMSFALPETPGDQVVKLTPAVLGKATIDAPPSKHWKALRLRLDLEGVAWCGGHWIVVSERLRRVFRIHPKTGQTTQHPLAWQAYQRKTALGGQPVARFSIDPNAGYEGIACDVAQRRLYIIQERQPRFVLIARMPQHWRDQAALSLLGHFDLPSADLPRRVGRYVMPPDFAGAHFAGRHLYLLARGARRVLKVDPTAQRIVQSVSYGRSEQGLYQNRKPFGLAEGLVMDASRIWIAFDNNGRPRRRPAATTIPASRPSTPPQGPDRRPVVIEFVRPAGF